MMHPFKQSVALAVALAAFGHFLKAEMIELTRDNWTGAPFALEELIDRGTVLTLEDNVQGGFATVQTARPLPVDPSLGYELALFWRGNDVVNSHARIAVCAVSADGAELKEFPKTTGPLHKRYRRTTRYMSLRSAASDKPRSPL